MIVRERAALIEEPIPHGDCAFDDAQLRAPSSHLSAFLYGNAVIETHALIL